MSSWRTRSAAGATAAAALLLVAVPSPAAAAAEELVCDLGAVPGAEALGAARTDDNPPHDRMGVARAHELARGRGTTVAVIDSGVAPAKGLEEVAEHVAWGGPGIRSAHGSIVAGLVAGADGVAPAAAVYDVKVFDADDIDSSEGRAVSSAGIAAGIRHVIDAFPDHRFDVVNISLAVPRSDPVLEEAIAELVALDTVVVAAAGNRPETTEAPEGAPVSDDEVYPADYPGVLAVSAVPEGDESPGDHVTRNLDTDVAAPTQLALSVDGLGQRCVVNEVATSWAAAEVSGIVALLRERFPDDTAEQTVARLLATTEGAGGLAPADARNPWTGAGVVQANDALTREVRFSRRGDLAVSQPEVGADAEAPPPPRQVDLWGTSRTLLLWTGLLAGALLALAFMLRPLIRR